MPYQGGSGKACSTRLIEDRDNELQKNGTSYNFQSATSGSGATIATDNALAPDSFCPLGWQLPYGGTGGDYYDQSKSIYYLRIFYGITASDPNAALVKIMKYPISLVLAGNYHWREGALFKQDAAYYTWTSAVKNINQGYRFVAPVYESEDTKLSGASLRCVSELAA